MKDLLKTPEVAKLLRVHPKHVYRLLAQGLPAHRVGSEWRFDREEVLAWSAGRSTPAAAAAEQTTDVAPLLAANGDLVIEVLLARTLEENKPLLGFVQSDRGTAMKRLASREILAAGFHGERSPAELGAQRLARIHLVQREVCLAYGPGTKLKALSALAKKRLATRPPTAGVRGHLDRALAAEGLSLDEMKTKSDVVSSHRDAVCAVVRGDADVALTTTAWARRVGLAVLPLADESYELLMFADTLGTRAAVGLCEVAQASAFRRALAEVPGYDAVDAGRIRYVDG